MVYTPTTSKDFLNLLSKAPLIKELRSDNTAELHFIHGPVEAFPPEGFEDYFGQGPYFRFIKPAETENGNGDLLERIRNFPKGATAEDQMRLLMRGGAGPVPVPSDDESCCSSSSSTPSIQSIESAQEALDYLYNIMEEDGIIGYSEGATVAATLLLHEQKRLEIEGREPVFKCGLFFAGWPPMTPELDAIVLADESDLTITIPTCHISKLHHMLYKLSMANPLQSRIIRSLSRRINCPVQHL